MIRARFPWAWSLLLVLMVVAVFQGALRGEFLSWDDDINITRNPHLQTLDAANLRWMFSDFAYMRRYVPLTWLDWSIDRALFGLTPVSAHAGNLLLHAINTVLVFLLVRRLLALRFGAAFHAPRIDLAAMMGAMVWALHPLRVEVVAWASGRIYCQTISFLLGATLAYLRAATSEDRRAGRGWFILAVALFAASLLTYPLALGFVAVLVVLDIHVLRRLGGSAGWWRAGGGRAVWGEKLVFLALTGAVLAVSLIARYAAQGLWEPPPTLAEVGIGARVMRAFYLWAYFVWKPLVPVGLAPVYTTLIFFHPADGKFISSALAVIAVTVALVLRRRAWPGALALWCCHLILLTPMLGLTEDVHYPNDRYSYLEGILWAVGAGAMVVWLGARRTVAGLGAAGAAFAMLSVAQVRIWRDSETLFRHLLRAVGDSPYAADITMRLADNLRGRSRFAEAAKYYRESLRIDSATRRAWIPHFGLGKIAQEAGNRVEAAAHYRAAVAFQPEFADAYFEFGRVLLELGYPADALAAARRGVELAPTNGFARYILGIAYRETGHPAEAVAELTTALRLDPRLSGARDALEQLQRR